MPPIMKKILYILLFLPLAGFGQDNYSLSFDGEDDYVALANMSDYFVVTDNYSFSCNFRSNFQENSNSKNKLIFVKIKKA